MKSFVDNLKNINSIKELFSFYSKISDKEDEYRIFLNLKGENDKEEKIKIHSSANLIGFVPEYVHDIKKYDELNRKTIIKNEVVQKFHPDKINNKKFWEIAKKKFPLFSVNGTYSKNINECNSLTLKMAKDFGMLYIIDKTIEILPYKINFFEIGYGHGNIFEAYKNKVNYLGIDYYKIKELDVYDNLLVIKKSGIPRTVKKNSQDIIYSFNVLQHCSQKDRFEYFKQSYDKLKTGGVFLGGMFLETTKNKDEKYWGLEDLNGRKYSHFFTQLTEVDTEDEFYDFVNKIGFEIIFQNFYQNYCAFAMIKK